MVPSTKTSIAVLPSWICMYMISVQSYGAPCALARSSTTFNTSPELVLGAAFKLIAAEGYML